MGTAGNWCFLCAQDAYTNPAFRLVPVKALQSSSCTSPCIEAVALEKSNLSAQKAELRENKAAEAVSQVLALDFKFKLQSLKDQAAKLLEVAALLLRAHENLNEKFTCLLLICVFQPSSRQAKPHAQKSTPLLCGCKRRAARTPPARRAVLCLANFFTISKMASQQRRLSGYAQLMPSSHTPTMTASFPDAPLCLL